MMRIVLLCDINDKKRGWHIDVDDSHANELIRRGFATRTDDLQFRPVEPYIGPSWTWILQNAKNLSDG